MSLTLASAASASAGAVVSVVINGTTVTVQCARDLTVAAGDVVVVATAGTRRVAIARCFPAAPAVPEIPPIPPAPKPAVVTGRLVVPAVYTGSYRSGWRTDTTDVVQGSYGGYPNSTGAAFYGSKPRTLAGATVTAANLRISRTTGGAYAAQSTTMRLITQATKPGGAPTLTSSSSGPSLKVGSTDTSFTIPDAWAQAMVDGTAGGIGFFDASGSPYVRFTGRGGASSAFTLTIDWRR